jgi:molybdate-binding protein
MLMRLLLQVGNYNEVDVVMEKDSLRQEQVKECLKSLGDKPIAAEHNLYHREIIGAVMFNKEYEAGVKAHQGR